MLLAIISILAGAGLSWYFTHRYAKNASREADLNFKALNEKFTAAIDKLETIAPKVKAVSPELSEEIEQVIRIKTDREYVLSISHDGDPCPFCPDGKVQFARYGNGPLGSSNAWYQCRSCSKSYQTQECSED